MQFKNMLHVSYSYEMYFLCFGLEFYGYNLHADLEKFTLPHPYLSRNIATRNQKELCPGSDFRVASHALSG